MTNSDIFRGNVSLLRRGERRPYKERQCHWVSGWTRWRARRRPGRGWPGSPSEVRGRERECVCLVLRDVIFSPWSHQPVLLKSDLQQEKCYFIRRLQVSTIRRQLLMMVLIVSGVSRVSRIFLHTGECAVINQVVHYILGQPNYTPGGEDGLGITSYFSTILL